MTDEVNLTDLPILSLTNIQIKMNVRYLTSQTSNYNTTSNLFIKQPQIHGLPPKDVVFIRCFFIHLNIATCFVVSIERTKTLY